MADMAKQRLNNEPKRANMSRRLSKTQLAGEIAAKSGLTKKASAELLDHLAALAYKHARETFTIPGIGKLMVVNRKARMGHNPKTLAPIQIPAKKALKFRIAQAAKDAILGRQ
jgi:DNA-binding protein HU-beta